MELHTSVNWTAYGITQQCEQNGSQGSMSNTSPFAVILYYFSQINILNIQFFSRSFLFEIENVFLVSIFLFIPLLFPLSRVDIHCMYYMFCVFQYQGVCFTPYLRVLEGYCFVQCFCSLVFVHQIQHRVMLVNICFVDMLVDLLVDMFVDMLLVCRNTKFIERSDSMYYCNQTTLKRT